MCRQETETIIKFGQKTQVPAVIFEMTSTENRSEDRNFKKDLDEGLGVKEYWLFDPKGESMGATTLESNQAINFSFRHLM